MMEALLTYMIKVTSLLALLWLFYSIALRRHTFYTANRWYFILGVACSFLLPCVSLPDFAAASTVVQQTAEQLSEMDISFLLARWSQPQAPETLLSASELAAWIIGGGILVSLFLFCIKINSFLRLKKRAQAETLGGAKVFLLREKISPFTFMGHIFLNPEMHSQEELAEILAHEISHIRQKHTIDLLLTEALVIVSWFNPFVWLLRKAMRQNLEYLADRQVLKSGFDMLQYQHILVRTSASGAPGLSMAHHFTFSNLKKRIIMMNKKRSPHMAILKYLLLVPLVAFAWVGVHAGEITRTLSDIPVITEIQPLISENALPVDPPKAVQQDTTALKRSRKARTTTSASILVSADNVFDIDTLPQHVQYYVDNKLMSKKEVSGLDRKNIRNISVIRDTKDEKIRTKVYIVTGEPRQGAEKTRPLSDSLRITTPKRYTLSGVNTIFHTDTAGTEFLVDGQRILSREGGGRVISINSNTSKMEFIVNGDTIKMAQGNTMTPQQIKEITKSKSVVRENGKILISLKDTLARVNLTQEISEAMKAAGIELNKAQIDISRFMKESWTPEEKEKIRQELQNAIAGVNEMSQGLQQGLSKEKMETSDERSTATVERSPGRVAKSF